ADPHLPLRARLPPAGRHREALPGPGRAHVVCYAARAALDAPRRHGGAPVDTRTDLADSEEFDARGDSPGDLPHAADFTGGHQAGEDLDSRVVTIVTQRRRNPLKCRRPAPESAEVGLETLHPGGLEGGDDRHAIHDL